MFLVGEYRKSHSYLRGIRSHFPHGCPGEFTGSSRDTKGKSVLSVYDRSEKQTTKQNETRNNKEGSERRFLKTVELK